MLVIIAIFKFYPTGREIMLLRNFIIAFIFHANLIICSTYFIELIIKIFRISLTLVFCHEFSNVRVGTRHDMPDLHPNCQVVTIY